MKTDTKEIIVICVYMSSFMANLLTSVCISYGKIYSEFVLNDFLSSKKYKMKKKSLIVVLSFLVVSFSLLGCSSFKKDLDENINPDDVTLQINELENVRVDQTGVQEVDEWQDLDEWEESDDMVSFSGDDNQVALGDDTEQTIKNMIEERKDQLWEWDELTEDDIKLMEDILNELVNSVK